jgi:hypothetical protein
VVDGQITLEAADFDCTKLLIAASVLLTSGVDRAVTSSASSLTPLLRQLSAGVARGATKSSSLEVAEAVLSFFAGATRSLHDRFGRYKEVDKATLRHFVEHGMSAAPETSEKEKGEDPAARAKRAQKELAAAVHQRPTPTTDASHERLQPTRARPYLVACCSSVAGAGRISG